MQVAFRDALLRLRIYSVIQDDYDLLSSRFWDNLSPEQRSEFTDVLHLLPTRSSVFDLNCRRIANTGQPVLRCQAKHNCAEAKKASEEDSEGLEKEILLCEGAKVMMTRNPWTSKGKNNCTYNNLVC